MRRGAALALAALALAGCGGGEDEGSGSLVWEGAPKVYSQKEDHVLRGTVRNDSLRRVKLTATRLRLLREDGARVASSATFVPTFIHGLYPPTREPQLSDRELRRTGRIAQIEPGKTSTLTVSWREPPSARPPVRLDYGGGQLPIPRH